MVRISDYCLRNFIRKVELGIAAGPAAGCAFKFCCSIARIPSAGFRLPGSACCLSGCELLLEQRSQSWVLWGPLPADSAKRPEPRARQGVGGLRCDTSDNVTFRTCKLFLPACAQRAPGARLLTFCCLLRRRIRFGSDLIAGNTTILERVIDFAAKLPLLDDL
jgi:hypothetical protein